MREDCPETMIGAPGLRQVWVVAVALIDADGRILVAQRPEGKSLAGLWEFPGGKIEPGEAPETALVREMQEELGIDTSVACLAPLTFASHAYPDFHLIMLMYACRKWAGQVRPAEGQAIRWVRLPELYQMPMPPADVPLVGILQALL